VTTAVRVRLADPYRDLTVIDSRAPRFNQAVIGVVSVLAVATGWWWLLAALAVNLAFGLTLGRRYCVTCVAYFALVQPRFGEGPLEDSRPPRVANLIGLAFLTAASVAYALGAGIVGAVGEPTDEGDGCAARLAFDELGRGRELVRDGSDRHLEQVAVAVALPA